MKKNTVQIAAAILLGAAGCTVIGCGDSESGVTIDENQPEAGGVGETRDGSIGTAEAGTFPADAGGGHKDGGSSGDASTGGGRADAGPSGDASADSGGADASPGFDGGGVDSGQREGGLFDGAPLPPIDSGPRPQFDAGPVPTDAGRSDAGACGAMNTGNPTCDQCMHNNCCAEEAACLANADCIALMACVTACGTDQRCYYECLRSGGAGLANGGSALFTCMGTCENQCGP